MVATTTGWYINPRALGTVPPGMKVAKFSSFTWVSDAQYGVVPKGVSAGIRTPQSIDAMAVIYTTSMAVLLLIALRFVNPTQLVARNSD